LTLESILGTHWISGWVDPISGVDVMAYGIIWYDDFSLITENSLFCLPNNYLFAPIPYVS